MEKDPSVTPVGALPMISIIMLYNPERRHCLLNTVRHIRRLDFPYEITLLIDGHERIEGFRTIHVPRRDGFYCWADAINAGVEAARSAIVLYMDCDRLPRLDYFRRIRTTQHNQFIFCRQLWELRKPADFNTLTRILNNIEKHYEELIEDHRATKLTPYLSGEKNPMSGCVAFTRHTYYEVGGFDPSFVGWGYPDYDFWMKALCHGCEFIALEIPELHQHHDRDGVPDDVFLAMNLWNGVHYFEKWGMPVGGRKLHALAKHLGTHYSEVRRLSLREFIAKYNVRTSDT